MAFRSPDRGMVLLVFVSLAGFAIVPVWGWGSLGGFLDHPARVGAAIVVLLACLAVLFTGAKFHHRTQPRIRFQSVGFRGRGRDYFRAGLAAAVCRPP